MSKEKIMIFDTTLRDGEQAPGASMSVKEKVELAHQLEAMNVDVIEAGFPISSPAQFEATNRIASELEKAWALQGAPGTLDDVLAGKSPCARKKRTHSYLYRHLTDTYGV